MTVETSNNQTAMDNGGTISFLDIGVEFAQNIKLTIQLIAVFLLIGLAIVLIKPSTFTASSKVVAEMDNSGSTRFSSGLSALKSFGLNLGSAGSGLLPETYPSLIKSREVLYRVIQQPFYFKTVDSTMKFIDIANYKGFKYYLKKYTYQLPYTIIGLFKPILNLGKLKNNSGNILTLTVKENKAISVLMDEIVSTNIDDETGIITISTKTSDRNLSASINGAVLSSFQERIRQIYDQKNSENLNFIETQLEEAQALLLSSEQAVIKFLERNNDPQTIQLQTKLERLNRDVSFKADLYSELQLQFAQTKIELKKKEPVIRIVERPSPPINPSGLGKIAILLILIFMGFLLSFIVIFSKFVFANIQADQASNDKIKIIKKSFNLNFSVKK